MGNGYAEYVMSGVPSPSEVVFNTRCNPTGKKVVIRRKRKTMSLDEARTMLR